MRLYSKVIPLIRLDFKFFYQFCVNVCHCISITWWVPLLVDERSPRAQKAKFNGRLRLIRSIYKVSYNSILSVYYIVIVPFHFDFL